MLFGDHLNVLSWVGISVVRASLLALAAHLRSWSQLRWPLATGAIIATYTLIDSSATRRSCSPCSADRCCCGRTCEPAGR